MVAITCQIPNAETREVLNILYDLEIRDSYTFNIPVGCPGTLKEGKGIMKDVFGGDGMTIQYSQIKGELDIPYGLWDDLPKVTPLIPDVLSVKQNKWGQQSPPLKQIWYSRTNQFENLVQANKSNIPISFDTGDGKKAFGFFKTKTLNEIVKTNYTMYELVKIKGHVRMYFDIEWKAPVQDASRFEKVLDHIQAHISHKPYILSASRPVKDDIWKHSYHLVFPTLVLESQEHLREYASQIMRKIHETKDTDTLFCDGDAVIDWGVYGRWQNFRLPFQAGWGKNRTLTPLCSEEFVLDHYLININDQSREYEITKVDLPEYKSSMSRHIAYQISYGERPTDLVRNIRTSTSKNKEAKCEARTQDLGEGELAHYLCQIPPDCDFHTWSTIAFAIHNCGGTFELFDKWSQGSPSYCGDCMRVWSKINPSDTRVSMGTLVHLAKQYNGDAFVPYRTKKASKFEDFRLPYVQDYSVGKYLPPLDLKKRITIIQAPMGSGKTYQVHKYIEETNPERVLIIAPRISYAEFVAGTFRDLGFVSYRDCEGSITHDRVVCSVESLHRLRGSFDLVIMDEIETILTSITSPTNEDRFDYNILQMDHFMKTAKVIAGDAFLTKRSLEYFKKYVGGEGYDLIVHQKPQEKKKMICCQDPRDFKDRFEQLVKLGKKIYLVCHSKNQIVKTFLPLVEKYNASCLVYHRDVSNARKETLRNAEEEWTKVQVVITSPTITIGVDQSSEYFDHRMLYTCSMSATPRDTAQALWRVRKTTKNLDYWYCDPRPNHMRLKGQPVTLEELKDFYVKKRWSSLPYCIASDEYIRELFVWNRLETNLTCIAFREWMEYFLGTLNYKMIEANSRYEDRVPAIKTKKHKYEEIPKIDIQEATGLMERRENGGDVEMTEMDQLKLLKWRFLQACNGCEVNADKLWKYCGDGFNRKPMIFVMWERRIPNEKEQQDIFYRHTHRQYEAYQKLLGVLPVENEIVNKESLQEFLRENGNSMKELADIETKGGNDDVIRTTNALLKRFSLYQLKESCKRENGVKRKVYKLKCLFPEVREAVRRMGECEIE